MRVLLATAVFGLLTTAAGPRLVAEQGYETSPVLQASEVLPEKMLAGDHFTVKPKVHNDGVMNHYVVDSDYGQFLAYGDLALARLIKEIHAITQLDEVSKTKVFAQAAFDSATGQVKTIEAVAKHPVGTVKGVPGGVKRMFHKYKRQAMEGYQTAKHVSGEAVDVVTPDGDKKDSKDDGTTGDGGSGEKTSDTAQLTSEATEAAQNTKTLQEVGVEGLEVMLKIAAQADGVDVAEFNLANTLLLAAYHKFRKPVTRVFPGKPVPVALDEDNGLFIIVSADDAFWDKDLGEVITLMAGKFDDMTVTDRELWLRGKASPRFETEVGDLGWSLRQQIDLTDMIKDQFTQPSEQSAPTKEDKEESGSG